MFLTVFFLFSYQGMEHLLRPVQSIDQSQVSGNIEDQSQVSGNFEEGGGGGRKSVNRTEPNIGLLLCHSHIELRLS